MKKLSTSILLFLIVSIGISQNNEDKLIGDWKYTGMNIKASQPGSIYDQRDLNGFALCAANYIFKKDNTIVLDERWIEQTKISKANWKYNPEGNNIAITYYYEENEGTMMLTWKVLELSEEKMILEGFFSLVTVSFQKSNKEEE